MDYPEEQANELQALESMYPSELCIESDQSPITFKVSLTTEDYADNEIQLGAVIGFTLPAKYPDEAPLLEVEPLNQLDDNLAEQLLELLQNAAPGYLGMVMAFSLISLATDWLTEQVNVIKDDRKREQDEKLRAHEESERKKFEGTRVTLDSFAAWKAKYDLETGKAALKQKATANKKPTGRQLFERDATLANSDLAFIKDDGDSVQGVTVDESLFQDLDELDLQDEDDSDFSD